VARLAASSTLGELAERRTVLIFEADAAVNLLVGRQNDMANKADQSTHLGLIIQNRKACKSLKLGKSSKAFIRRIREDGRIDLLP